MQWFCEFAVPILAAIVAWPWYLIGYVSHVLYHVETHRAVFDLDRKCQEMMRWNLQEAEFVQVTS